MIIAVTGITGHTGGFFIEELVKNNFDGTVRCLVRETSNTAKLDASGLHVEKVCGSIKNREDVRRLVSGADAVMHIAGIRDSISVLNVCIEENVRRAVLVHTTGMYSKHKMASEEYKQVEDEMHALLKEHDMDITVLRPTMIFGDMRDHNIHKFIKMVDKLPIMPEIDHGSGKIQPVNARDLGRAFYQTVTAHDLPEEGYTVSGERELTLHELFDLIGEYLGKDVHHLSCPMGLGVFLAKCLKAVTGGKKDFVEKVLRMGEDRNFKHDEATRDFAYQPEAFNIGLKREVEEYMGKRNG